MARVRKASKKVPQAQTLIPAIYPHLIQDPAQRGPELIGAPYMSRPHQLALTPEQIEEARCLKATRSWAQLAKRYKTTVNRLRYVLNADQERARTRARTRERVCQDPKAERQSRKAKTASLVPRWARRKAKAQELGFRSVYQMEKVRSAKPPPPKVRFTMRVPWAVP